MRLAPLPASAEAAGAGLTPLVLPPDLRLSPEQFALVCDANPEAALELAADGRLIATTPTGGDTGRRNSRLIAPLQSWADQQGGLEVFDSSTGFRLADGSVLSPEQHLSFPPPCPDPVIELASPGDEGPRANGPPRQVGHRPGQRGLARLAVVSGACQRASRPLLRPPGSSS